MEHPYSKEVVETTPTSATSCVEIENDAGKDGDDLLIDLVRGYPFLYDKSQKDYKNALMKTAAWEEIAIVLQQTEQEVELRWQRLRERYSKERKKIACPSGSGSESVTSTWYLFEKLQFLNEHMKRRNTVTNANKKNPPPPPPLPPKNATNTLVQSNFENVDGDVEYDQLDRSRSSTPSSVQGGSGNFKRRKVDTIDNQMSALTSALCTFLHKRNGNETPSITSSTTTAEDQFAVLVSTELKRMPVEIQRERKRFIMNLLYEPF